MVENPEKEDVKGMYILLFGTLEVVMSAVRGTTRSSYSPSNVAAVM